MCKTKPTKTNGTNLCIILSTKTQEQHEDRTQFLFFLHPECRTSIVNDVSTINPCYHVCITHSKFLKVKVLIVFHFVFLHLHLLVFHFLFIGQLILHSTKSDLVSLLTKPLFCNCICLFIAQHMQSIETNLHQCVKHGIE